MELVFSKDNRGSSVQTEPHLAHGTLCFKSNLRWDFDEFLSQLTETVHKWFIYSLSPTVSSKHSCGEAHQAEPL